MICKLRAFLGQKTQQRLSSMYNLTVMPSAYTKANQVLLYFQLHSDLFVWSTSTVFEPRFNR